MAGKQKAVRTTPRKTPKVTKTVRSVDGSNNPVKYHGMGKKTKMDNC